MRDKCGIVSVLISNGDLVEARHEVERREDGRFNASYMVKSFVHPRDWGKHRSSHRVQGAVINYEAGCGCHGPSYHGGGAGPAL